MNQRAGKGNQVRHKIDGDIQGGRAKCLGLFDTVDQRALVWRSQQNEVIDKMPTVEMFNPITAHQPTDRMGQEGHRFAVTGLNPRFFKIVFELLGGGLDRRVQAVVIKGQDQIILI